MMRNTATPPQVFRPSPARSLTNNSALRGAGSSSRGNTTNADFIESAEYVTDVLRELGFPREINTSMFTDKITVQGMLEVTNFLLQKIDPHARLESLDEVPAILRFLKYPSTILQKSQWNLSGVSSGRQLLPIYHWLAQLVLFDQQAMEYPEVTNSDILDMLRSSYEATVLPNSRDMEILNGVCQYMTTAGLMEKPSEGRLWEEYNITMTDIDDFVASVTRLEPSVLEDTWGMVTKFHEHLIWMMGRHTERNMEEAELQLRKTEQQLKDTHALKRDYEGVIKRVETSRKDLLAATNAVEDFGRDAKQMAAETQSLKSLCTAKQNEINQMNCALSEVRDKLTKQGMTFTEAERLREDTTAKMHKTEELQSQYQKYKARGAEADRKLREDFKSYSSIWKDFVSVIINESSSHLPNHDSVRSAVWDIQRLFDFSQEKADNRRVFVREAGFRLDYDQVVAFMSNRLDVRKSDQATLNDILRVNSSLLLDHLWTVEKVIRREAVQSLKDQLTQNRLQFESEQAKREMKFKHDQETLAKREKEFKRVVKANEQLEIIKSDREKALNDELKKAETELSLIRRKHQAILEEQASVKTRELQDIQAYLKRTDEQRKRIESNQREFELADRDSQDLMQTLSKVFTNAIIEIALSLPVELIHEFPVELQRVLRQETDQEQEATEMEEIEDVATVEDLGSSSDEEYPEDAMTDEKCQRTDENTPVATTTIKPLQNMVSRLDKNMGKIR
eukprot:Gregarina_sp_Pseudo_9__5490@NODE_703_length_2333_cov_10_727550_g664_i0_p1_GENE_NODE_703_length_2333_cov_10_727550_g664_i0NODE_703_length_2333_cov_10_727550_g664_i0_p1_ORF_typecomplete_len748_score163_15Ndc80_HEC/PF03801_13/4_4e10Ndc80_HEC/PF03801_13/5_3e03CCDC158/PF15921_5/0_00011CCDC158/PF15921_5/5_2e03CCDC158/PF15921_5/8_7e03MAD/PF05557_13/0_0037MAD/PF05557_13/43Prominin/PF05478_11/0_043Prominin/PF05478_11/2_5e02_NODE_703_length_2333_cov_10_727550_g664_i0892296